MQYTSTTRDTITTVRTVQGLSRIAVITVSTEQVLSHKLMEHYHPTEHFLTQLCEFSVQSNNIRFGRKEETPGEIVFLPHWCIKGWSPPSYFQFYPWKRKKLMVLCSFCQVWWSGKLLIEKVWRSMFHLSSMTSSNNFVLTAILLHC